MQLSLSKFSPFLGARLLLSGTIKIIKEATREEPKERWKESHLTKTSTRLEKHLKGGEETIYEQ